MGLLGSTMGLLCWSSPSGPGSGHQGQERGIEYEQDITPLLASLHPSLTPSEPHFPPPPHSTHPYLFPLTPMQHYAECWVLLRAIGMQPLVSCIGSQAH